MSSTGVLIVAAGRGHRAGGTIPKQYVRLCGEMVLTRTLRAFADHPRIDVICVVIHPDDRLFYDQAIEQIDKKLTAPVHGGDSRQQSVLNGLDGFCSNETSAPRNILIHDAARPFIPAAIIDRVIDALEDNDAVLPVIPATDTIKQVADERVEATLDRGSLFGAQTPQGFRFETIRQLHERAAQETYASFTDDASIAEFYGDDVRTVAGAAENIKLTTPLDMKMGELMLQGEPAQAMETRTGMGFDVHAFEQGDKVILCGIEIPHRQKLKGHSDADVAMHALTDAILGALAEGDIGNHFPPSDPKWKGVPSELFLRHAMKLVEKNGGRLLNMDITIICEQPRVGPHREAMREKLAELTEVSSSRISIKATTTEKLGFTGRNEGIAAQAIANIALPAD